MAYRDTPTLFDADNISGSCTLAARNDWRNGDADSMSARVSKEPTSDAGYTTAGYSLKPQLSISFLYSGGESIYDGLGLSSLSNTDIGLCCERACLGWHLERHVFSLF